MAIKHIQIEDGIMRGALLLPRGALLLLLGVRSLVFLLPRGALPLLIGVRSLVLLLRRGNV